jgi:hypothetical protein
MNASPLQLLLIAVLLLPVGAQTSRSSNSVSIARRGERFVLLRGKEPYYIKGIGGHRRLELAAASGANSLRTWSAEAATDELLQRAHGLGMTVTIGFRMSQRPEDYGREAYKARLRQEVRQVVKRRRDHPAVLLWAIGNEIDHGADTPQAWRFVDELAAIIAEMDPDHPIMTVIAGANRGVIDRVAELAPGVQTLGINAYRSIEGVPAEVRRSRFEGPYIVTEWGPDGHWEVPRTKWDRPIEQSAEVKARLCRDRYALIERDRERCLGSYVFLWGQKQERTPTWYGMFLERRPELGLDGEALPTVDAMVASWRGSPPKNRCPVIERLRVAGKSAGRGIELPSRSRVEAVCAARDPDGDRIRIIWEMLEEPTELGTVGSFEPRPPGVRGAVLGSGPRVRIGLPRPGAYRLFVYVLDGRGKATTANVPLLGT